jgi:hypothetical protein
VRQFAHKGFRIEQLSTEAKVLYTAFLAFSLAGLLVSVVYYDDLVGDAPLTGAKQYYAGELAPQLAPDAQNTAAHAGDSGPEIELPDEVEAAPAGPLIAPMTTRKLLEVTHFHLFTVPVFLLIIAHLFLMCLIRPGLKIAVLLSALVSTAAHIAAPWLVFECGSGWAWAMPVTGSWMMASMLVLTIWPAWAMWRHGRD